MSQSLSRRQFIKLAGTAASGAVLAACTGAIPPSSSTTAPTSASNAEATTVPETAPTTAPAELPEAELNYYFLAWGPMQDAQLVADEMSKITLDQIKAKVKLTPMDWSAFNEKLQLALAAGEAIDLMFTCTWANNFYANVSNGNLLPLDDLLPQYAPKYWASIKPDIWNAGRVKSKLYGAINEQIWASILGFDVRKDIVEKYKWDISTLKSFEDYIPFFDAIKKDQPSTGMWPTGWFAPDEKQTWWPSYWGYDDLGLATGTQPYVSLKYDDPSLKASFCVEAPEYKTAIDLARKYYTAGYLPSEPTSGEDFVANMKAGKYACVPINSAKPGRASEDKAKYGFDFVSVPMTPNAPPIIGTGSVAATMNGIARTCKNPERTAMLLELLNTNVDLYTLICKGIEGTHWVWQDKGKKVIGFPEGVTAEKSTYNPNTDWMFGNQFNAPFVTMEQAEDDVWNATRELNESAAVSAAMGFAFVQDPVTTEISQIATVNAEVGVPLSQGRVDPEKTMPEYLQKLRDAGGEKFLTELQTQLDEWKKTQK